MAKVNPAVPSHGEIQPLLPGELAQAIGEVTRRTGSESRFVDYRNRRAEQTLRRQDADLDLFKNFLNMNDVYPTDLGQDSSAWQRITGRFVEDFVNWQIAQGYAIQSINVRLSSIKTYARLAMQSGVLSPQEYALIHSVQSYGYREQNRIDARRKVTRIGLKKSEPVKITPGQAALLKQQPDTPQGRRDTLMMCLLLDHGLRVYEVAALSVADFNFSQEQFHLFHSKEGKDQVYPLTRDTLNALAACRNHGDLPLQGRILRRSLRNEELGSAGMTGRAITARVGYLGERIGIARLSANDCRHFWVTSAARHGTDPLRLQESGA